MSVQSIIIEDDNIRALFTPKFSFVPKKQDENKRHIEEEKFVIGNIYSLSGVECDDFKMPKKEYELIAIVSEVNGVNLDSLVMKQVNGDMGTIFSLTKNDCRLIGIEFQKGLQLFPKNMNWIKVIEEVEESIAEEVKPKRENEFFDENDLSTYPVNFEDKTIRHMIVEISNIGYDYVLNRYTLPNGGIVTKTELENMNVKTRRSLFGDNVSSSCLRYNQNIEFKIKTNEIGNCTTNGIVDENGKMYIELIFTQHQSLTTKDEYRTLDKHIGLKPTLLKNLNINSLFSFEVPTVLEKTQVINKTNPFENYRRKYGNSYRTNLIESNVLFDKNELLDMNIKRMLEELECICH